MSRVRTWFQQLDMEQRLQKGFSETQGPNKDPKYQGPHHSNTHKKDLQFVEAAKFQADGGSYFRRLLVCDFVVAQLQITRLLGIA